MPGRVLGKCGKRELTMVGQARDPDADEAERPGPVTQRAVEQSARQLADLRSVVDADSQG